MAMDPRIDGPATLLILPAEIMEAVANELPKRDLPSLRLVCRDTENKTLRSFEQRCISNKAFAVGSSMSMTQLQNISEHTRFSKVLSRVNLVLQEIEYSTANADAGWKQWAAQRKSGGQTLSGEQRTEYLELRQTYQNMLIQQRDFAMRGFYELLSNSLKILAAGKTNGVAVSVVQGYHGQILAPPEFGRLQPILGLRIGLVEIEDPSKYLMQIFRSAFDTHCCVSEIIVPKSTRKVDVYAFDFPGENPLDITSFTICGRTPYRLKPARLVGDLLYSP